MANLTMNKIHKQNVGDITPFHVWLNMEKELYTNKKGLNPDENKKDFNFYMNSRYRAGGSELWQRYLEKVSSNFDGKREYSETGMMTNVHNIQDIKTEKESVEASSKPEGKPIVNNTLPFLKRKALGMPMPLTIGLTAITITAFSWAAIETVKYLKNKKSE